MPDDKPITTEDLYGKSEPVHPTSSLPIEETPEIVISPSPVVKKSNGCMGTIGKIVVFIGLFAIGIWSSSYVRQFLQPTTLLQTPTKSGALSPSPTPISLTEPVSNDPYAAWKTYDVISGITKLSISGLRLKLPSDTLAPICDGANCASQGTYLPGGTRLTIAPRGTGQVLRDFRGTVISDVNGKPFTTKKVTVAGLSATEFAGEFVGRTVSGYAFNKMRGVMIELTDTTSLELNHFTPSGITSDFAKDDVLFDTILKNLTIAGSNLKGAVIPMPTKVATSSGY